ncbi:hypothetical protein M0Q97_10390 [Candidatus Dojkabacteria bacterium]|jgi:hypothetical protein|nr:hypothetical protein [Candidatus Dojkabacteria bacterium]
MQEGFNKKRFCDEYGDNILSYSYLFKKFKIVEFEQIQELRKKKLERIVCKKNF